MHPKLTALFASCVMLFTGIAATQSQAETVWQSIKPAIFQDRVIHFGRTIVELKAPYRTADDRIIPIQVKSKLTDGRTIRSITLVADDNPMPVIAVLRLTNGAPQFNIGLNIRLDGTSMVRAVVEASDGSLYMAEKLIKTSGQGACASPPVSDLSKLSETLGKMRFSDVTAINSAAGYTSITRRGRLQLTHPNLTGLQMDQITLQHIPARYIDTMTVLQGDQQLFTVKSGITLSENPEIEFEYRFDGSSDITVLATDTDGTKFVSVFPIAPGS